MVCFDESTPDHQDVSNSDISTLSLRTDINALIFATLIQLFIADWIVIVRIVLNSLLVGVPTVIKEHASTGDSMFGPVMNGAFVVGFWTHNVFTVGVVVEGACLDMGKLYHCQ